MTFNWGMVGHGHISTTFGAAIQVVDDAEIVAVAGRNADRSAAYAQAHGIGAAHDTVEAMLAAGGLDAVYVCSPHPSHQDAATKCLRAGVPVLVEKPMTPSSATTKELIDVARGEGVFAMEAMWTRFLPAYEQARAWIDDRRIGEVQQLEAAFGFRAPVDPDHRLFNLDLAGGSTLDVGVYPIALAQWLFGVAPTSVAGGRLGRGDRRR